MSKTTTIDIPPLDMTTNTNHHSSSTPRSKKLAPPPLRLPAIVTNHQNEDKSNFIEQQRTEIEMNSCSCSSTSDDCAHKPTPFVLPVSQRAEILDILKKTSSTLLVPPQSESKQKRSSNQQPNLLRDRQTTSKPPLTESEWIDFVQILIQKPLCNDLKNLIEKYKSIYFDRMNGPNTTDETIRSSLSAMINEALFTCTNPSTNENGTSPTTSTNLKRKRDVPNGISTNSLNNQTKFVISYFIAGRIDGNKTFSSKQKKLQKIFSQLFKYVPDKDDQTILINQGRLKSNMTNENICLMLHDEVFQQMDEQDREFCGISLDDAFTLPESIFFRISSIIK